MPKLIRYCTDNCGPGRKYREKCPLHHGIDLNHVDGLAEFKDQREVAVDYYCVAANGHRICTLKKERVDYNGEPI